MTRRLLLGLAIALSLVLSTAAPVLATSYTGSCGTANHIDAHIFRNDRAPYQAARGTVEAAQVLTDCTGSTGASFVFPANIASGSMLAQLGYGRIGSAAAGFLYTPSDHSSPLGNVTYWNSPCGHAFQWHDSYRFTIAEYNPSGLTDWKYTIEDLTDGWTCSTVTDRTTSATQVWYQVEYYQPFDTFGGQGINARVSIVPMEYRFNNNSVWTTLTDDFSVDWDCWGCTLQNPSYVHATASSINHGASAFRAWIDAH